jgi:hypothetical protein
MRDILPALDSTADAVRDGDQSQVQKASRELMKAVLRVRALARELDIHTCIPRNGTP